MFIEGNKHENLIIDFIEKSGKSMLYEFLTMRSLIIDFVKSMIAFLSCGVPYGELYLGPACKRNDLIKATRINCTYLLVVEAALAKT